MKFILLLSALVWQTVGSSVPAGWADPLLLVTEDRPPRQMMVDGVPKGIAVEKVQALLKKAGIEYSIEMLPFARAYQTARVTPNTGIFTIARTPAREKDFIWVEPPLLRSKWVLFALLNSRIKLSSLKDAGTLEIGTYLGDSRDAYLKNLKMNVDTAPDDATNLKKLMDHKIDLWAADELSALDLLKKNADESAVVEVLTFNVTEVFLALNPETPASTVEKIKKAAETP